VRERLLTAASELIVERGWSAVSTRVLAERAQVGAGLVHYHFTSLNALLNEAALAVMTTVAEQTLGQLEGTTPQEGLDLALAALDAYPGDDPASTLFVEAYLAAGRDAELRSGITRDGDSSRSCWYDDEDGGWWDAVGEWASSDRRLSGWSTTLGRLSRLRLGREVGNLVWPVAMVVTCAQQTRHCRETAPF
jgi:AcrR family transcriptional regulator